MRPELRVLKGRLILRCVNASEIAEMRPELRVLKDNASAVTSRPSRINCRDATRIEGTESLRGAGCSNRSRIDCRDATRIEGTESRQARSLADNQEVLQRCDPN